jgi:hypothetical protein
MPKGLNFTIRKKVVEQLRIAKLLLRFKMFLFLFLFLDIF